MAPGAGREAVGSRLRELIEFATCLLRYSEGSDGEPE
jgi:hypothetical protein